MARRSVQKTRKKKLYNYTVIFEPAEEGGYIVRVPALPGCLTQGETFEEAEAMARDAVEVYLESLRDLGEKIPVESEGVVISKIHAKI